MKGTTERIRVFFFWWLSVIERLLTDAVRNRRHPVEMTTTVTCLGQSESLIHVLRGCKAAIDIWSAFSLQEHMNWFCQLETQD